MQRLCRTRLLCPVSENMQHFRCALCLQGYGRSFIVLAGRPSISTPARFVWFTAPSVFSQARSGNIYLSTARARLQSKYIADAMRELGFPIVDAEIITQSRWDASYDGLHYASAGGTVDESWYSQVSYMVYQAVLNTVFPTCSG